MFRYLLLAAFLPALAFAQTPFELCYEGYPGPTSFNIPQCPSLPCGLAVGDEITLEIGIITTEPVSSLPVSATISDGIFTNVFPLPTGDACTSIVGQTACPQTPGSYVVRFTTRIALVQPGVPYTIRVQIAANTAANVIHCGEMRATFA